MESDLQNKLHQFSAHPPAGAWQKIADALDNEASFSQRLYAYEEQPPLAAWSEIEKALEEKQATPVPVVPFFTRFRKPIRYAVAACFLAVILVTVTLSVKRTEAGALQAGSDAALPTTTISNTANNTQMQVPPAKKEAANEAVALENTASKKPAKSEAPLRKNNAPLIVAASTLPRAKTYVTFADGDGRLRKISRKMAEFVQCDEDDLACKQRLQKLRQKMASAVISTDFTGVLEMMRHLQ